MKVTSRLGDRIRRARLEAGMNQNMLAGAVGLSNAYVSEMELGRRNVPMERLYQMCNLFPDEDSAEWLWLKLSDEWGNEVADTMLRYAQRQAVAERR